MEVQTYYTNLIVITSELLHYLKAVLGFLSKVSNSKPWWNSIGKENGVLEIFFCLSPRK